MGMCVTPPPTWTRLPADLVSGARWIDGSGVVRVELRDGWWTVARDGTRWLEEGEAIGEELRRCDDLPW